MSDNPNTVERELAWKREGLPGMPMQKRDGRVFWISLNDLLRDDKGRIITAPAGDCADELMSAYLGKTIELVRLYANTIDRKPVDTVAFRYAGTGRLSFMERRAAAALVWVTANYYAPMKRRDRMVFPTALNDLPKELQSPRLNTQMWRIFTEDKAVMVADVLMSMFSDVEATVFEDGDGWYVAIDKGQEEFEGTAELERVETILWALSNFDVVPNPYSMKTVECDLVGDEIAEAEAHLNDRAVRAFNAHAAQQRIEKKLDALLSRLDAHVDPHRATKAAKDAPAAVGAFAEEGKDPHTLPGKPAAKSKSRK